MNKTVCIYVSACLFIHATSDVVPFLKRVFPSNLILSSPQSPLKNRTDPERSHTADLHNNLFSTWCCAPHPRGGATDLPNLWPRTAASRDTVRGGAVATGVPTPQWATAVLSWHGVSGRGASGA